MTNKQRKWSEQNKMPINHRVITGGAHVRTLNHPTPSLSLSLSLFFAYWRPSYAGARYLSPLYRPPRAHWQAVCSVHVSHLLPRWCYSDARITQLIYSYVSPVRFDFSMHTYARPSLSLSLSLSSFWSKWRDFEIDEFHVKNHFHVPMKFEQVSF